MKTFRVGLIYKATNRITGLAYIGMTRKTKAQRWAEHVNAAMHGSSFYLHRAIRKYGAENFTVIVLKQTTEPLLATAEVYFIAKHNTFKHGYTMTAGGEGVTMTAAMRRRLSKASKLSWLDETKRIHHMSGITDYTRSEMSAKAKARTVKGNYHGVKATSVIVRKVTAAWKRADYRAAHDKASKLRWTTAEAHTKMSSSAKLRCTEEWRKAVSERSKARWLDPAYKAAMKAKLKAKWAESDVRARHEAAAPVANKKNAVSQKKRWTSEAKRQAHSITLKKVYESAELRKEISNKVKAQIDGDPLSAVKRSSVQKTQWQDPVYKAQMVLAQHKRRERERLEKELHVKTQ